MRIDKEPFIIKVSEQQIRLLEADVVDLTQAKFDINELHAKYRAEKEKTDTPLTGVRMTYREMAELG